jgi:hypothetical protein
MHSPNPNCFQLSRKATIREVDVAKLGDGFRWLTPLFSRAYISRRRNTRGLGVGCNSLFGGIPEPSRLPGHTPTQDAVHLPKMVQVVCRFQADELLDRLPSAYLVHPVELHPPCARD